MGLDQYAYVAADAEQWDTYWENYDFKTEKSSVGKPLEISYWRKHPNLQGWMKNLWEEKGGKGEFACQLELTIDDLKRLEKDIKNGKLPPTTGCFFGNDSDEYYKEQDLKFIKDAKGYFFLGQRIFYNSSW